MRSFFVFAITTFGALAAASAASSDNSNDVANASESVYSYSHGHLATFKPVVAGYAIDPASERGLRLFVSEDPDFCAHTQADQVLHDSKTLVFALRNQDNGLYAIDLVRSAWGTDNAFASAQMLVYNDQCVDVGDARHLGEPSIFPFGAGVGDNGWIRIEKDASEGSTLSAEYGVSLGSEGFPATLLKGVFKADLCEMPVTGNAQSCL